MRIQFKTDGGVAHFPGLSKPVLVDSAVLPTSEAHELEQLVEQSDFFKLPKSLGTLGRGAADVQSYTITVEDGKRQRTVRVTEPIEDPALRELVAFLRARAKEQRAQARPKE